MNNEKRTYEEKQNNDFSWRNITGTWPQWWLNKPNLQYLFITLLYLTSNHDWNTSNLVKSSRCDNPIIYVLVNRYKTLKYTSELGENVYY